ncbi:hypothetical protein F4776DRAFT_652195 [Hypoxylon sp. NC0597]|nr:hypothetical protein F4776DRAFT_652195 [Hypoxylon sp. NC0597]
MEPLGFSSDTLIEGWDGPILGIGLDMGTTCSGASFGIYPKNGGKISVDIIQWQDPKLVKIPSKISYDPDGECTIGPNASDNLPVAKWFKLLLPNRDDLPSDIRDARQIEDAEETLEMLETDPVQITADYLQELFRYVIDSIRKAGGNTFVDSTPFRVIVTVPAVWSDHALGQMKEAVELSDILDARPVGIPQTTVQFITEPEAAAIGTISLMKDWYSFDFGDSFVVADLGGGTVDCISYVVDKTNPFQMRELVKGEGALCGATFLDHFFIDLVETKLRDSGYMPWREFIRGDRHRARQCWEHEIKRPFNNVNKGDITFKIGRQTDSRRVALRFNHDDIRGVFEMVCPKILELIQRQLTAAQAKTRRLPKCILLVGGLGQNQYIYELLKEKYAGKVAVLQVLGNDGWTSVSRGAVLCGGQKHRALASPRTSRYSYGWATTVMFEEGVHDPADKFFDWSTGKYMASNQMFWVIKQGDDIDTFQPLSLKCERRIAPDAEGSSTFTEVIYKSKKANPSDREGDNSIDEDVTEAASLVILSPPAAKLPLIKGWGESWYTFAYDINAEIVGCSLRFTVTCKFLQGRVELAKTSVNVVEEIC